MINTILDSRYEIIERIGGGGMADVYRAHDKLLDRFVAVKILHAQFANDDEFVIKFKREAQGAAKLSHPNIVNIYDVGRELNTHYIVMEYVSGETLKEKIQREGILQEEEALHIAREIARALEHAHQNNLVHCDIKPHNILVTKSGGIKVTDFGIARAATSSTMTYSGTIIGSVHYFSPEQAKGSAISTKSDIYSLGVVLYEMLTGCLPFIGESPIGIALKHIQEEPLSIRNINAAITPLTEAVVVKSMAKNPEDRFDNISDMIVDLKYAETYLLGDNTKKIKNDEFATQILQRIPEETIARNAPNELEKNKPMSRTIKSKTVIIVMSILLVLGFVLGAFLAYGKFWSSNEVTVPNVVGKQLESAKHTLESENLRVNIEEAFDAKVPSGQVVSQYPEAGAIVKEQRTITIYISKGGEAVNIPDLKGLARRDAEIKLKNLGLQLGRIDEQFSDQPFDTVISQNPRQGTQVTKGYTVDIVISKGSEQHKLILPDFKGLTLSSVSKQLESSNLKVGKVTEVEDSGNSLGTILTQNPEAGTEVLEGTTVDLTIVKNSSKKSATIELTVPDGSAKQAVQFIVTDANGRRVVYENVHKPGDRLSKTVEGSGQIRVQIYINGKLLKEQNL